MTPYASFQIAGQDWTAHLVSKVEMKKLAKSLGYADDDADHEGLTNYEMQQVYLRRMKNKSRMRDTFLHEICHAFLDATGVGHQLKEGFKGKDYDAWEETLIRVFVPHLATFIDEWSKRQGTTQKQGSNA